MFNSIESGLTLGKAVSGISKSLNVVNQLIPIYKEFKPTVINAKNIIKSFSNGKRQSQISTVKNNKKTTNISSVAYNNPKFFI